MTTPVLPVRHFIINLGRSGSSLLAAILADAGANFGLDPPETWDPRSGQMESRAIKMAAHHYRRAYDIDCGRKYVVSPRLESKYRLNRGRRYLLRALNASEFLKISDLDLVVQASFKLGFCPRVIVSYRQLEAMLPSLLVGRTHTGPDQLASDYVRIYRQAIVLLRSFGGCVVAYNELQDPESTQWAEAVSRITSLTESDLLESRARRLNGVSDEPDLRPVYADAYTLFGMLDTLRGKVVPPSRQVLRALTAR